MAAKLQEGLGKLSGEPGKCISYKLYTHNSVVLESKSNSQSNGHANGNKGGTEEAEHEESNEDEEEDGAPVNGDGEAGTANITTLDFNF